jgi:hypothetical protein
MRRSLTDHISDLTPGKGERVITVGGTRAGKSALMEWGMRDVQRTRPTAMQILVDTKPRFRAEKERGRFRGFRGTRKPAAYRYENWTAGPVVPNSVVVDIWDEDPFKNLWHESNPNEIAIMQGAEFEDWKRMLLLLKGFVNAQIKGRERRIIVDECLDFTSATHSESTPRTMFSTALHGQVANVESVWTWVPTGFTECRLSSYIWLPDSTFSIFVMTEICDTSKPAESAMLNPPKGITYFDSTEYNPAALSQNLTPVGSICPIGT